MHHYILLLKSAESNCADIKELPETSKADYVMNMADLSPSITGNGCVCRNFCLAAYTPIGESYESDSRRRNCGRSLKYCSQG
jgi:hypothetical protein